MSEAVLEACVDWVVGTGGERLVLHHFGEPLLHPRLLDRLRIVAKAGLRIQFSTNALLLEECWETLLTLKSPMTVMVAFHQWVHLPPSEYLSAVAEFQNRARGTKLEIVPAYAFKRGGYALHQWAQGDKTSWDVGECPFLKHNLAVVLWNGDIAACCVDHEGATVRFNILDPAAKLHLSRRWNACARCDVGRLMRGEQY